MIQMCRLFRGNNLCFPVFHKNATQISNSSYERLKEKPIFKMLRHSMHILCFLLFSVEKKIKHSPKANNTFECETMEHLNTNFPLRNF